MNNPYLHDLHEKALSLPIEPGVYIMKNAQGKIIYIGKAKILKNRVTSYFRSVEKHLPKVYRMVENVKDFEYIVTDSEFEALILECSMIKLHSPKYNILLKDDKGYNYIRINPQEYSRITAAKQKNEEGQYLGPYTSSFVVKQTVDEANKVFMLPTCSRRFPQEIGKGRPCLNYYIKQCSGLCRGKITLEEHQNTVSEALDFIRGGGAASIKRLSEKMEQAAEELQFELAAYYRDRINAIHKITEEQKVIFAGNKSLDVIALVKNEEEASVGILKFRDGRLTDKEDIPLGAVGDHEEALSEFITGYYYTRQDVPTQVWLDSPAGDMELLEQFLREQAGRKVELSVPSRGEGRRLVEMARNNAAQAVARVHKRSGREIAALDQLGRLLGLAKPPAYIEAYDISNIGSSTIVGGMVAFENGRPLKSAYRKFKINDLVQTDDYAAMCQMLSRRLAHYEEEKESGQGFGRLPDLILLDGGKGHVSVVTPVVRSMGFQIPIFGMVKDDRHRTRAIAANGGEIALSSLRQAFTLVAAIQEEVHRYSIGFSRQRHKTTSFELSLSKAPGIGETRARNLYKQFRTFTAIQNASVQELAKVKGMNQRAAQELYDHLHDGVDSMAETSDNEPM